MEENSEYRDQHQSNQNNNGQGDGVVFLGWQRTRNGEEIPLYNVTAEDHPLYGSTVTDRTLREHNLPVPRSSPGSNGRNGNSPDTMK